MAALRDLETEKLSPWNRDHRQQGSPPPPKCSGTRGQLGDTQTVFEAQLASSKASLGG